MERERVSAGVHHRNAGTSISSRDDPRQYFAGGSVRGLSVSRKSRHTLSGSRRIRHQHSRNGRYQSRKREKEIYPLLWDASLFPVVNGGQSFCGKRPFRRQRLPALAAQKQGASLALCGKRIRFREITLYCGTLHQAHDGFDSQSGQAGADGKGTGAFRSRDRRGFCPQTPLS